MGEEDEEERNQVDSANDRKGGLEAADTSKKFIRVITVIAYLFSVSTAATMLSLYYLFFWNPPVLPRRERLIDPIPVRFSHQFNGNLT